MAPLMLAARNHPLLQLSLIATGQQDALFDDAIASFGVVPDAHLGAVAGGPIAEIRAALIAWLGRNRPHLALVQGDTNTALAGAQAAAVHAIPLGHVEAGLRTYNSWRPFPEENNRVAIAQLAALHFAPAQRAADNLKAEGARGTIHVTGNSGIDALRHFANRLALPATRQHILITCHRRENFGTPLLSICAAIRTLAAQATVPLLLPVHPNPNIREVLSTALGTCANLSLIAPLSFPEMITAIRASVFVFSDSGGLQEECAALGVPLLLMREETERQELVESGNVRLVGSDTGLILHEAERLLTDAAHHARMSAPSFPYGEGDAAPKTIAALEMFAASR